MVPRKLWVSESFGPISKSWQPFDESQSLVFCFFPSQSLGFSKKGLGFYHSPPPRRYFAVTML